MLRFYIIPLENINNFRGPKYFHWLRGENALPELAGMSYRVMDFGAADIAIVKADVTSEQHAALTAQSDVYVIPAALDNTVNLNVTTVRAGLEALGLPGNWVQSTTTYRQILQTLASMFEIGQSVAGLTGNETLRLNLDLTFNNLKGDTDVIADWLNNTDSPLPDLTGNTKAALVVTAVRFGYDYSALTGATTLRQALRTFAQQRGTDVAL